MIYYEKGDCFMDNLENKYVELLLNRCLNFEKSKSLMIHVDLKENIEYTLASIKINYRLKYSKSSRKKLFSFLQRYLILKL